MAFDTHFLRKSIECKAYQEIVTFGVPTLPFLKSKIQAFLTDFGKHEERQRKFHAGEPYEEELPLCYQLSAQALERILLNAGVKITISYPIRCMSNRYAEQILTKFAEYEQTRKG